MRRTAYVMAAGLLAAGATTWMTAQDRPAAGDEAMIRQAAQDFARAFEKGNAAAVAGLFTEQAEYSDDSGQTVRGRQALSKAYADFFAARKQVSVEARSDSVRMLGSDTAIEDGTFTVRSGDAPTDSSRYSAIFTRQDGKWRIALLKEWADERASRADLNDLAFLVGAWESDGGDVTARTTYEWAEGKRFIRASYTLTPKKAGEAPHGGTQIIGVDPSTGSIRSWVFDSEGGIGEAAWFKDGARWVIESGGTLADGSETSAVNILTPTGSDAFSWQSGRRLDNGQSQPDIGPVKVRRVAAGR